MPGGKIKEFLPQIFVSGRLTMFLVSKKTKIKYSAEGSILNVDLGLF